MNPTIPAPARPATAALLTDFSDRLSPILVKELRQGLRQPTFVIAFLCLQVLLCIVVVAAVATGPVGSQNGARVGETVSGFFFVLLSVAIMVVQPLRGLSALAAEIKEDTLDLLLLTRLNAWRITFGKWLALVSQSALLVVAVFPYLILRYYLGGMQMFAELLALVTLFIASASLTGITVGFSASTSPVIRGLVALALIFGLLTLPNIMMFAAIRGGSSPFALTLSTSGEISTYAGLMLLLVFFGYYFLEMGATQISPAAENRSTCKRLVGLAALGLLVWLLPNDSYMLYTCWLLAISLLTIDALSERPGFTASVLRPFQRLGPSRYLIGPLLLPGWASGLFYAGLLAGITMILSTTEILTHDTSSKTQAFWPLWFATLWFPAVVVSVCMRKAKNLFNAYIIVLLTSLIVSIVFFIIGNATSSVRNMLLLVPVCPALGLMSFGEYSEAQRTGSLMVIGLLTCCAHWTILLLRSLGHWARIRAMDQTLNPKPLAAAVPDTADVA